MGHNSVYIQLEKAKFQNNSDELVAKATNEPEHVEALLEVGFETTCKKDGSVFLRKCRLKP